MKIMDKQRHAESVQDLFDKITVQNKIEIICLLNDLRQFLKKNELELNKCLILNQTNEKLILESSLEPSDEYKKKSRDFLEHISEMIKDPKMWVEEGDIDEFIRLIKEIIENKCNELTELLQDEEKLNGHLKDIAEKEAKKNKEIEYGKKVINNQLKHGKLERPQFGSDKHVSHITIEEFFYQLDKKELHLCTILFLSNQILFLSNQQELLLLERSITENLVTKEHLDFQYLDGVLQGVNAVRLLVESGQWDLMDKLLEQKLITIEQLSAAPMHDERIDKGVNAVWLLAYRNKWGLMGKLLEQKLITIEELSAIPEQFASSMLPMLKLHTATKNEEEILEESHKEYKEEEFKKESPKPKNKKL